MITSSMTIIITHIITNIIIGAAPAWQRPLGRCVRVCVCVCVFPRRPRNGNNNTKNITYICYIYIYIERERDREREREIHIYNYVYVYTYIYIYIERERDRERERERDYIPNGGIPSRNHLTVTIRSLLCHYLRHLQATAFADPPFRYGIAFSGPVMFAGRLARWSVVFSKVPNYVEQYYKLVSLI